MGNQVWGLSGDRVLVDGDRAIRKGTGTPNQSLATGVLRMNADVEWSFPTGKLVLARTATGRLVKRQVRIDLVGRLRKLDLDRGADLEDP